MGVDMAWADAAVVLVEDGQIAGTTSAAADGWLLLDVKAAHNA
jgi:hypothetical protein